MDLQEALDNFRSAIEHCDNLLDIHKTHGGSNRGVRMKEPSLNRAVVVLAVAAWQAAVQDAARSCIDLGAPTNPPQAVITYKLQTGFFNKAIGDFATPSAEKSRDLLKLGGIDIKSHWTWRQGVKMLTFNDVSETLNKWLKVRHALAHGHQELPSVDVLEVVRQNIPTRKAPPSLRRDDAEACVKFLKRIVNATLNGVAAEYGVPSPK